MVVENPSVATVVADQIPKPVSSTQTAVAKSDIYGSTLSLGVAHTGYDRATRRFLVENVENTNAGLRTAIVTAVDGNQYHPNVGFGDPFNKTLPCAYARATRFGPSKVFVDLHYRRGRSHFPANDTHSEIASFRGGFHNVAVYGSGKDEMGAEAYLNGLPAGIIESGNRFDYDMPPTPRAWQRATIHVHVPTILGDNPLSQVAGKLGKVNDGDITFSGFTFAKGRLRFDSVDINWIQLYAGTNAYVVDYNFTAAEFGWYSQSVKWVQRPIPERSEWVVFNTEDYQQVSFTSPPFPLGTR